MINNWSKSAVMCYNRNGKCKGCIYSNFESCKCQMKKAVKILLAKFGKPKRFLDEEN